MRMKAVMSEKVAAPGRGLEEHGEDAEGLEVDAVELEGVAEAAHAGEEVQNQASNR